MALNAGVAKRGIFVAPECEDCLVHLLGVENPQLHEQVEAICEEFGANLSYDYEGTSLDTLRQMIAMGMGISFLPGLFVQCTLGRDTGVVALELRGRSLYRTIGMAWRRTSAREAEFRALLEFVHDTVSREFPDFRLLSQAPERAVRFEAAVLG